VREYLTPLMTAARNGPLPPRSAVQETAGKQRLATLRDQGAVFERTQRTIADAVARRSADAADDAVLAVAATAGVALQLIFVFVV
jgi:hypothetical protein